MMLVKVVRKRFDPDPHLPEPNAERTERTLPSVYVLS